MYLQYQSEKGTNNAKNVVFYALCILYVFSFAGVVLEVTRFIYVSNNSTYHNNFFTLFSCAVGSNWLATPFSFAWNDIERVLWLHFSGYPSTHRLFPSIILLVIYANHFKDLPLLDCVGKQHPCCGASFNSSIHIPRWVGVNLFSLTSWSQFIVSSYLASLWLRIGPLKQISITTCMAGLDECWKYCYIHDCECSRDGLNRVQDLQGVPGSQAHLGLPNFGRQWREQNSDSYIYNNRIRHGINVSSSCASRCCHCADRDADGGCGHKRS